MPRDDVGSAPYYGGIAFGAGYILAFSGALVHLSEVLIPFFQANSLTTVDVLIYTFVFLYMVCGIYLGVSITQSSRSARDSGNADLEQLSRPITSLSLMMLFLGIANLIYVRTGELAGLPSLLNPSILFVVSPILLLIGFKMYKEKPTESRAMGALLMFVSTVLLYFFAYRALGEYNILVSDSAPAPLQLTYSLSAGPFFCQFDVESISLLLGTLGSILYVVPAIQKGFRHLAVDTVLVTGVILFSIGLMIFNFPTTTDALTRASRPDQQIISMWIIAFGSLTLGISGLVLLISALLAAVFMYRTRLSKKATAQTAQPQGQPPVHTSEIRCRQCGWKNPADVKYCGKCGTSLTEEETKLYE
jgi:hypothetical protein